MFVKKNLLSSPNVAPRSSRPSRFVTVDMTVVDSDINLPSRVGIQSGIFTLGNVREPVVRCVYSLCARREKRVTGPQWFPGRVFGFREGASPRGTPHRTFASHTHPATMAATVSALRVVAPVARVAARKATAARTALVVKVREIGTRSRDTSSTSGETTRAPARLKRSRTSRVGPPLESRARACVVRDTPPPSRCTTAADATSLPPHAPPGPRLSRRLDARATFRRFATLPALSRSPLARRCAPSPPRAR